MGFVTTMLCPFFKTCKLGDKCGLAATQVRVAEEAVKWKGAGSAPSTLFVKKPVCWTKKTKHILSLFGKDER